MGDESALILIWFDFDLSTTTEMAVEWDTISGIIETVMGESRLWTSIYLGCEGV